MAKIKVTGLNKIKSNIRKFVTKELRDKTLRNTIGRVVVEDIRKTTFRAAAPSTQKYRAYLEKYNKTHKTYNRTKINVTFTGELLNDLLKNVKFQSKRGVVSYIISQSTKLHKKYKGKKKGIGKKRSSYADISDGLINKRKIPYLTLQDKTLSKVLKLIRKTIESKYKNF